MTKENTSPEIQKGVTSSKSIVNEPYWTKEKIEEFADKFYKELEPMCKTPFQQEMAKHLSALVATNQNFKETLDFQYSIIARLIKGYDELFRVYNDLCTARNKDSRLIVDIGSTVDKRFGLVGDHLFKEIADLKERLDVGGL